MPSQRYDFLTSPTRKRNPVLSADRCRENRILFGTNEIKWLLNHVKSHIRLQGLGDADTFRGLEIFKQGRNDSGQG